MKQLVFHYWCDNAAAQHPRETVEGDTLIVWNVRAGKPMEIDLCNPCLEGITYQQMQDLVQAFGRDLTPVKVSPEKLVCPLGCNESRPFKDPAGRTRHMTRRAAKDPAHARWLSEHADADTAA